jgi:hypothetical protein
MGRICTSDAPKYDSDCQPEHAGLWREKRSSMTKAYKRVLDSLMSSAHCLEVGQEYSFKREYTETMKSNREC